MFSSSMFDTKKLTNLTKKLHNHERVNFPLQYSELVSSPLQRATLSILNLQINQSLDILNSKNGDPPVYFERKAYVISKTLRKVGEMVKILASLCVFRDEKQECLAFFETVNFYRSKNFEEEYTEGFMRFLQGIFPLMNVHKDNTPLYMPFHQKLQNYHEHVGNPNWEISRQGLDDVYRREILGEEEEAMWYLFLTGNRKMLERFGSTSVEKVWAYLYFVYVNETLRPYRYVDREAEQQEKVGLEKVVEVIEQRLKNEPDNEVSHLLMLVLYVITDDNDRLEKAFDFFAVKLKENLTYAQTNPKSKIICSQWGLINAFYTQLLHNYTDHFVNQGLQSIQPFQQFKNLLDESVDLTLAFTQNCIPFYDFYLRIAFTSNIKDNELLKNSQKKVFDILTQTLERKPNEFIFPEYGFWDREIMHPLSARYIEKFPQKLVQIVNYLPQQSAIWKLLNCEKLTDPEEFSNIREHLSNKDYKKIFIEEINKTLKITQNDYDDFLKNWSDFHLILSESSSMKVFESVKIKVRKGAEILKEMIDLRMNSEFKKKVYLPFSKSENILNVMKVLIDGYEELLPELDEKERKFLLKLYLSILLDERIKKELIGTLKEEDATEFWKKWSLVYMTDQSLVNELINKSQGSYDENKSEESMRMEMEDERQRGFGSSVNNFEDVMEVE